MSGQTSGQTTTKPKKVDPKAEAWVRDLLKVGEESGKDAQRNDIIGRATLEIDLTPEALGGMKFDMLIKKDANFKAKAKSFLGMKQDTMTTLTGTGEAMDEFDTVHDFETVEPVDPKILEKAMKSLEKIADASQKMNKELMELYAEEFGIDPEDFETLEIMISKKKTDDKEKQKKIIPGSETEDETEGEKNQSKTDEKDWDKLMKKFEELQAKVDKEVRDEVWQPLVRQGLMPENFVPDRHSEVARTFDAASKLYEERLKEYTSLQDDNSELMKKLGLGNDISSKILDLSQNIISAIPGAQPYAQQIQTGFQCVEIIKATGFQVAGQVIQKKDAVTIGTTVAGGITGLLKAIPGVPPDVAEYVTDGMQLALKGGKIIQALMDGKPEDVWTAIGNAVTQGLSVAATASGNPVVGEVSKDVASFIAVAAKGGPLYAAMKERPMDKDKVKQALAGLMQQAVTEIGNQVSRVVQAEQNDGNVSSQNSQIGQDVTSDSTTLINMFIELTVTNDKATTVSTAIGTIAQNIFTNYLPDDYGSTVGTAISSGLTNGTPFIKAIVDKKPEDALKAFGTMVSSGLTTAAQAKGVPPEVADGLNTAANMIAAGSQGVEGMKDLYKAIKEGNTDDAQKAITTILDGLVVPVLNQITGQDVSTDDDSDNDTSSEDDTDEGTLSKAAQKELEENEKKLKLAIENANKIINDPKSKPEDIKKAKEAKDAAVKAILEGKAAEDEILTDTEMFSKLLNPEGDGEDDGDTRDIENMIAIIQRDRAMLEMINNLASMGIEIAAKFFPPAGAAMDFKTFALEAAKTVAHLRQLAVWMKNAQEAKNAVTVQVHTMLNRVGLETEQAIEHQVKATIALVSAIGNVVATVGAHAAPIGVAMVASAKIAGSAFEIALTVKSEAEMKMAWDQYMKAFKNPKDRKNIRMALQKNATLAKYGLVWGALKDGNPIAKKALKRCGLTDAVLAKPSANENKVVEYLEVLFNEDPIVLKMVPDTNGWEFKPPKPELKLRTWVAFLQVAQKKGKLAENSGGAVTATFADLEPARTEVAKAKADHDKLKEELESIKTAGGLIKTSLGVGTTVHEKPKQESEQEKEDPRDKAAHQKIAKASKVVQTKEAELKRVLTAIKSTCLGYKPLNTEGQPHEQVKIYAEAMAAFADTELREMNGEETGVELDKAA